MDQAQVNTFVAQLDDVQSSENYGYTFFFVGDDHTVSFVTTTASDNEYDKVSNLDREGVFAVNIGIRRATFDSLVGDAKDPIDYAALNVFMPHPDYAKQHFVRILNPSGDNVALTQQLITEAYEIAAVRMRRREGKASNT